jgi:hypothetical protein
MTGTSRKPPTHDFSDRAMARASIAALVAGFILTNLMAASWSPGGGWVLGFDPARGLAMLPLILAYVLNPLIMVVGAGIMFIAVFVGWFVMAAYKGDHTTYRAAMIIGARTGAIVVALPAVIILLANLGDLPNTILPLLFFTIMTLVVGALTGLAARAAAGAPTLPIQPAQSPE